MISAWLPHFVDAAVAEASVTDSDKSVVERGLCIEIRPLVVQSS